ncbi:MAG: type I-MYXAN CRISPR-associated protein Cas6/Cmx6 [Myxococcota bacterium]
MSQVEAEEVVDVAFPLKGKRVPLDHGYALFGALSRELPALHEMHGLGLHAIRGKMEERGTLTLRTGSSVTLRVPTSQLGLFMTLVGKTLELDGHRITLLPPRVFPLRPVVALKAHLVTIKNHKERATFIEAVKAQLAAVPGLQQDPATIDVVVPEEPRGRRILRVAEHKVVGFVVGLDGLGADASLAVQRHGLGGRRHMGAGVFVPARA